VIVNIGLKTDEGTCPANKHCFLVYILGFICKRGFNLNVTFLVK